MTSQTEDAAPSMLGKRRCESESPSSKRQTEEEDIDLDLLKQLNAGIGTIKLNKKFVKAAAANVSDYLDHDESHPTCEEWRSGRTRTVGQFNIEDKALCARLLEGTLLAGGLDKCISTTSTLRFFVKNRREDIEKSASDQFYVHLRGMADVLASNTVDHWIGLLDGVVKHAKGKKLIEVQPQ